jgi:hypothetical protein
MQSSGRTTELLGYRLRYPQLKGPPYLYLPSQFEESRADVLQAFMRANPLAAATRGVAGR